MDTSEKLAAVAGVALAASLGFCFGKVTAYPTEQRCLTAVADICMEQVKAECGKDEDADCLKFGDRYCRARAGNECGGDE